MEILMTDNKYRIPRVIITWIFFLILALCLSTFLRILLLLVYPLIAIAFIFYFRLKIMPVLLILLVMVGAGWLLSFFNGWYLLYNMVSFYYMIPFLLLFFSVPVSPQYNKHDLVKLFFKILTWVA